MTLGQILNLSGLEVRHLKNGTGSSHEVEGLSAMSCHCYTCRYCTFSSLLSACKGEPPTNQWKAGQGNIKALVLDDRPK